MLRSWSHTILMLAMSQKYVVNHQKLKQNLPQTPNRISCYSHVAVNNVYVVIFSENYVNLCHMF